MATLRRTRLDGTTEEVSVAHPQHVHDAVGSLDPSIDRELELVRDGYRATVWPVERAATETAHESGYRVQASQTRVGTVVTRLEHGGIVRWLGRTAPPSEVSVAGLELPATVVVPTRWASVALWTLGGQFALDELPWHDADFRPLGPWRADAFAYEAICVAPQRRLHLDALAAEILSVVRRLGVDRGQSVVGAELLRVGHDVWNYDYDGQIEMWGSDHGLLFDVRRHPTVAVRCRWTDDPDADDEADW